jgi:folate-binding protein YgfZ
MPDLALTRLDDLAVTAARGPDAVGFLQGQLSRDLSLLEDGGAALAGLHNPQGRCLAVLRVLRIAADQLLLVHPAELAGMIRPLLGRYVLRARLKIEDVDAAWRVYGATGPDAAAAASTRLSMQVDATGSRQLIVAPRNEPLPDGDLVTRELWRLDDIAAGLPEVLTATSGMFVAQMLNLDLLGAISFDKGCYTGQEIIARAHYRGQVKRRMQRFITASDFPLDPGVRLQLADGRTAQVVTAAPSDGGGQEFLAVTTLAGGAAAEEPGEHAAGTPAAGDRIDSVQLPLPYAPR